MGFNQYAASITDFRQAGLSKSMAKETLLQSQNNANVLRNNAESVIKTSLHNSHQIRKDGNEVIAQDRARSGASNVASSGSTIANELDLASRLEQNIRDNAHYAMEESRQLEHQANMEIWQGKNQARALRKNSRSQMVSGIGNFMSGLDISYTRLK